MKRKTKKYWLAMILFSLFIYGCSDALMNVEEIELESTSKSEIVSFKISKEKALKNLIEIVEILDEEVTVRSGESKTSLKSKLQNITINDVMSISHVGLRSANTNQEMLYLINFDDESGYAVLSADERIPDEVLAITEQGSLSNEDFFGLHLLTEEERQEEIEGFEYFDSEENDIYAGMSEPDNINYICQYMVDYAEYGIEHYDDGGVSANYTYTQYHNWESKEKVNALLDTKWHQSSPFNDFCPKRRRYIFFGPSRIAPAGCVPIAVAQIMSYHEYPHSYTYNGIYVDWKEVKKIRAYNMHYQNESNSQMAAALLRGIGNGVNIYYGYRGSMGLPSKAKRYLSMCGYDNVKMYWGKNESKALEMLRNNKPVFMSGVSGLLGGHAWVIDGFRISERFVETKDSNGIVFSSNKETKTFLHCNFGWGGKADGYYTSGIFDTKKGAVEYDEKDIPEFGKSDSKYTWLFNVITYNVNK